MKSFNKSTAFICIAACLSMPFALAACGGSDNAEYSVSEAEWRAALNATLFQNVTQESVMRGGRRGSFEENGITVHYTVNSTQITKVDLPNGIIHISGYSEYEYDADVDPTKHPNRKEDKERIFIKTGDVSSEYTFNEEYGWCYEGSADSYFDMYDESTTMGVQFASAYKSFKFDDKTGNYILDIGISKMTLRFENKRLVFSLQEVSGMSTSSSFKDYGTTVVEIPDDLPPSE